MSPIFGKNLRLPAVAGQFYPEDKKELGEMIDEFLKKAQIPEVEGEIFGLILPHAGYIFSGQVSAYGAKAITGKNFDTVIILGDSHYEYFDGVSIWPAGFWETPLGKIEVDKELAEKILSASDRFLVRDSAHLFEHSIEVQIPFLQKTLKNFKILPIIFGSENKDWKILSESILENIKAKKVLIVASSDFSHYPKYEDANYADKKTIEAILTLKVKELDGTLRSLEKEGIQDSQTFLCAEDSVKTLLEIMENLGAKAYLLKYANSGDTAGEKSQVVGYGAIGFFLPPDQKFWSGDLTAKEKGELLNIAKTSVESYVFKKEIPKIEPKSEKLKSPKGIFVTLKKKGHLRGCIGEISGNLPLYEAVSQMAVAAAAEDPRFYPITPEELNDLEYEISVLTPLRKIKSVEEIKIGKHGVQTIAGSRSGLFLPQVATENGWNLEEFLENLMLKAGLPQNYWRENPVDFYVFEAEVFGGK